MNEQIIDSNQRRRMRGWVRGEGDITGGVGGGGERTCRSDRELFNDFSKRSSVICLTISFNNCFIFVNSSFKSLQLNRQDEELIVHQGHCSLTFFDLFSFFVACSFNA